MGVILIIIYYIYNNLICVGGVTHFLCGKCGKCGKCYPSAFWIILVRRLDYFNTFFPTQKPYFCTEFQSALKLRKQRKQRKTTQETMSLPIFRQRNQSIKAEFNLLLRSRMPTMLIYAKIAAEYGISEDRVRQITLNETPSISPLKGEYSSLPLREGQGGSIPTFLPLLHHNTCHTCNNCHISI